MVMGEWLEAGIPVAIGADAGRCSQLPVGSG